MAFWSRPFKLARGAPALLVAVGVLLSALGAWEMRLSIEQRATQDFGYIAQRTVAELERRFRMVQYGLNGAKGAFVASQRIQRAEFRAFVEAGNLSQEFPGVRGFGFAPRVMRKDLANFLKRTRADGAPNYAVQQRTDSSYDDLYPIQFIEPLNNNAQALGLDMGTEPQSRAAIQKAIDTGEPTVSAAIALVQDVQQTPGVLMFVPMYRKGSSPQTIDERRQAALGVLYAPVVVVELLQDLPEVVTGVLELEIFDSALAAPPGALLFDADRHQRAHRLAGTGEHAAHGRMITQAISVPGREFTLHMSSTDAFDATLEHRAPWLVLLSGVLGSVLLATLLRWQTAGRERAERLAHNMAQEAERLAMVVQHTGNAVSLADAQGRITWVNAGFTQLTGYSAQEALGKTPAELLGTPHADPDTLATLAKAAAAGKSCSVEVLNRAKDGHEYWTATEVQPQHDAAGRVIGFMEIGIDITEQRRVQVQLETALRENDALLSTLNLHAIVSVSDRTGALLDANDAFCTISGYSRGDMLGQNHRLLNSGVHPTAFWKDMWATISTGLPWRGKVCNKSRAGSLYWVDTFIAPFIGEDGQIDRYIAICTDITDNVNAQEELRISQERFVFAVDGSGDGVWDWDMRDNTVQFSLRWKTMLGFEDTDIGTTLNEWSDRVHPDDLERVMADVQAHLDGQTPGYVNEHRVLCKDGSYMWILDRGLVVKRNAQGQPERMVGTHTDISVQKETALALQQAKDSAQAASQSKSQFLANMSHEIRTPMNAILGMLTLLRKTQLSPKQADYAAKSEGAARSLLGLINEILDFSKIEAGKMTLDAHPFGLDPMLRDLSVILASSVGGKPVEVLYQLDPSTPSHVVGDAMRIQQVLLNLCSNAIKFTQQGEVVLSITVMQRTVDAVTLQFSVQDTGIGIAPENQARIFSGFTQAEASTTRRFGGTGLGVAISQRFVRMMGGELELHSKLGEGSRFYFTITLPVAPAELHTLGFEGSAADTVASPMRVLVVDDNPLALALLSATVQSLGWEVDSASSGEQALALVQTSLERAQPYQALFIDWRMPGLDGWETSERIRQLTGKGAQSAPVLVMVTATDREKLAQRSAQDQALLDGFLVKPVTASMLQEAVEQARQAPTAAPTTQPHSPAGGQRLLNMRLLVVEDNLNNQQVARELLEDEGAVVQIANHGREGVEAIAAASPAFDVVLMDLQMPVMDGITATRYVRQDLAMTALPIVAMTANAMASDREACLAAGMNDHVGKPFDLNNLVQVLRRQAGWFAAEHRYTVAEPTLSQAQSQAAVAAGVDIDSALRRLGGKHEVYQRMLASFVHDLQALPHKLQAYAAARDSAALARAMHTLKGLAATLGADALSQAAGYSEKLASSASDAATLAHSANTLCDVIAQAAPTLHALAQAWAPQAQVQAVAASLDPQARQALRTLLQLLAQQLVDSDMDAMNTMADVQQRFGDALGAAMAPLEAEMSALEFDAALPHCRALLGSLNA